MSSCRIMLHSDSFDRNGQIYNVSAFSRREGSTAVEFDVVINPYTKQKMVVPFSEVEWLDEE